ncbi:hypothetical protein Tco_1280273 [Tanacetum coccineum]
MVAICVLFSTRLWNLVTYGPSEILDKGERDNLILTLADNNHPIPTLPPAWTKSGVMLVLPADPGLWSDVISRWESITINRLNSQTWFDNKAKLAFVENLLGESKKLMWQQWRTAYPEAYSALKTIVDDPQNITSQVRQLIIMEDPYRGSTDEQDRAYRDLDRITCE